MLEINNLHAGLDDGTEIIRGLSLCVPAGEVHAIMGPNGSGKSTTAHVLAGKPGYQLTAGEIKLNGQDISGLEPEERAAAGLFLAFQYPVEIPGVSSTTFLKAAVNAVRNQRGEEQLDGLSFVKLLRAKAEELGISQDMLKRAINVGFSGGEKKRFETLQMSVLEPSFCILDETDSGLDVDALRTVADGVNKLRSSDRGFLVITHYQRLLDYIVPDKVHVLRNGIIERSGGAELALDVEKQGYGLYQEA